MNRLFQCLCISIIGGSVGVAAGHTTFTLEAGTFQRKDAAEARAAELRSKGFFSATVDYVKDAPEHYNYRVFIGDFASKAKAKFKKDQVDAVGMPAFVRGKYLYKHDRIDAAVAGKLHKYFFLQKGAPVPASMTTAPLEGDFRSMKEAALEGPTTAPETIAAYKRMVDSMPDNHPLKGREVIGLARRIFAGHSAYERDRPDFAEIKEQLMKVATKKTSATAHQRRVARDMVVHIVHYYEHDYVTAIRAYKQIINAEKDRRPADTAVNRTSLAGAIFEVSKVSDYSATKTQEALYDLWQDNVAVQNTALTSNTQQANDIRYATARIGLMLSESYLQQKMWDEAEAVAENLVESYTDYEDCWGAVAEACCHLTHVYAVQNRPQEAYRSGEAAITWGRKIGKPVWGDKRRDVIWKSYTWQRYVSITSHDQKKQQQLEAAMQAEFPKEFADYTGKGN